MQSFICKPCPFNLFPSSEHLWALSSEAAAHIRRSVYLCLLFSALLHFQHGQNVRWAGPPGVPLARTIPACVWLAANDIIAERRREAGCLAASDAVWAPSLLASGTELEEDHGTTLPKLSSDKGNGCSAALKVSRASDSAPSPWRCPAPHLLKKHHCATQTHSDRADWLIARCMTSLWGKVELIRPRHSPSRCCMMWTNITAFCNAHSCTFKCTSLHT